MSRALLIAEKPSLMLEIRNVYNKHKKDIPYQIDFLAQHGHTMEMLNPDELDTSLKKWDWATLPIYPEDYGGYQYKVKSDSKDIVKDIKEAINSGEYDFIIHAGDPDQEGELLVNLTLEHLRNTLPVKRFWSNDLTEEKVLAALQNLKDDSDPMMQRMLESARTRQQWDWIFGMNLSRAGTLQMGETVNMGRVMTVLLSIVAKREEEIKNFVPKTVYGVDANYTKGFSGKHVALYNVETDPTKPQRLEYRQVWLDTKQEADTVKNSLAMQGVVSDVKVTHKKESAPKQFKLSTAQMVAGKSGIDDATTLSTIQGLYENKYMSYPRTDCEFLSSNEDFEGILNGLASIPEFTGYINRITNSDIQAVRNNKMYCNDKKLESSGHSALIPTKNVPNLTELSNTEKFIYLMIARRFIAMFLPQMEKDIQEIIVDVQSNDGIKQFRSTNTVITNLGYAEIFKAQMKENGMSTDEDNKSMPSVQKGELLDVNSYETTESTSKPPKRFTSPDLIGVCENPAKYLNDQELKRLGKQLSIGTPATRSSIIEKLYTPQKQACKKSKGQYGTGQLQKIKEGKQEVLVPSELGQKIYDYIKGLLITKVDMTARWEEGQEKIRNGEISRSDLDKDLEQDFEQMMKELKEKPALPREYKSTASKYGDNRTRFTCPLCGEGTLRKFDWGLSCSEHKKDDPNSCNYVLWKKQYGKELTEKQLMQLLDDGKTGKIKFHSAKTGKDYEAYLVLGADGKVSMEFPKNTYRKRY